jgi:hypothetical protein
MRFAVLLAGVLVALVLTDKEHSSVFRIDPATNQIVDSFSAGPGAYAMARIGGSVWITSFAGNDVRRFVPRPAIG